MAGMERILPDGLSRIKSALDGLFKKGYVTKTQNKASNGKFGKNVIEINEKPFIKKPLTEKPLSAEMSTEEPTAENRKQYNNKEYNRTQCNNNPSIHPSNKTGLKDLEDGEGEVESYRLVVAENIRLDCVCWRLPDYMVMMKFRW